MTILISSVTLFWSKVWANHDMILEKVNKQQNLLTTNSHNDQMSPHQLKFHYKISSENSYHSMEFYEKIHSRRKNGSN